MAKKSDMFEKRDLRLSKNAFILFMILLVVWHFSGRITGKPLTIDDLFGMLGIMLFFVGFNIVEVREEIRALRRDLAERSERQDAER